MSTLLFRSFLPYSPAASYATVPQPFLRSRSGALVRRESFVTETVFSHPSKLSLVGDARAAGYIVALHVVVIPVELTVARVADRVARGGDSVPEVKVRERYARLWPLVASAVRQADRATVYDNSRAAVPFRVVAKFFNGAPLAAPAWPTWAPAELRALA